MNNISVLIVDDDLNKISAIIHTIKEVFSDTLLIVQASCVQEAIENLQNKEFHLLITDLQMPLRHGDAPDDNGGQSLVRALYKRRNKINVPMYVVGLTQFENLKSTFNSVWMVWHFDGGSEAWKNNLRDLIHHISLVKSRVKTKKIETIFLEGVTDKKIIQECITHFFLNISDKIYIHSINFSGGASWVERQLFIWAKSLSWKSNDQYLKAVGIFDDDDAGNKSIDNIREQISLDSAESQTFSIVKSAYKYSVLLKSIKSKGLSFPTSIEDLISIECWKEAKKNGWLEKRDLKYFSIHSPLETKVIDINEDNLKKNGFTSDEVLIILNKVKDDYKVQFSNLVGKYGATVLESIKFLLMEVFEKLKIDTGNIEQ